MDLSEEDLKEAVEIALNLHKESPDGFTAVEFGFALGLDPIKHPYHRNRAVREIKVLVRSGVVEPVHGIIRKNVRGRLQPIDGYRLVKGSLTDR